MRDRDSKTNAMRALEARGIRYVAHRFSSDIHSANGVAEALGLPEGQVFKTLVVMPVGIRPRPLLAIIAADRELDLRKLAKAHGAKKLRMAAHKEAESLTGLLVGGISTLALLSKGWEVFLDTTVGNWDEILVSAGQRGINVQLPVEDLIRITRARVADISHRVTVARSGLP